MLDIVWIRQPKKNFKFKFLLLFFAEAFSSEQEGPPKILFKAKEKRKRRTFYPTFQSEEKAKKCKKNIGSILDFLSNPVKIPL